MREIFIKYNPYRLETFITIDGNVPKRNSRLNFGECRLQEWIEDLPKILFDECSSRDFKIIFHGTILDYEDVEAMVRAAKKEGFNIELEHIPAKEVSDKEAAIDELFDEIQAGPFDELKQPNVINKFKMAKSKDLEVAVVATMSAGKSTLINALLGQKLMPAKNMACTATITEIKDNDVVDYFMANAYNADGELIDKYPEISLNIMKRLNDNSQVSKIRIEGNIPFVSSEDISLVLVDTPGTNNARNQEHKVATYNMLSESSKTVVLYILNATQPCTNDDNNLLRFVAKNMKKTGKLSRDRFIFVVNKLDEFKKDEDDIQYTIKTFRDYLHTHGIENANIYPVSALTALNIRTILVKSDDDDNGDVREAKSKVDKFNRNPEMHFETLAPLTPSAHGEIEKRLADAKGKVDTYEEALIHCGIVPIEMAIEMYVQKYAKTAKIKNLVDAFKNNLDGLESLESTKQRIAKNYDKKDEIKANIIIIKEKIKSGKEAQKFASKIKNISYDGEFRKMVNAVYVDAQGKITPQLASIETELSKQEAEERCRQYAQFVDNLQAEVQVQLEELIQDNLCKSANELLEEYKRKLSGLTQDVNVDEIKIEPFKLMAGDVSPDIISDITEIKRVKVGEKWIENKNKKWYKPWTWFQEKGHWEDVYRNKEYVSSTELSQRFFAPIEEQLRENCDKAIEYAEEQTQIIKEDFSKKFTELDVVLNNKLQELIDCIKDVKDVERRIRESENKTKWLKKIKDKTNAILDI